MRLYRMVVDVTARSSRGLSTSYAFALDGGPGNRQSVPFHLCRSGQDPLGRCRI